MDEKVFSVIISIKNRNSKNYSKHFSDKICISHKQINFFPFIKLLEQWIKLSIRWVYLNRFFDKWMLLLKKRKFFKIFIFNISEQNISYSFPPSEYPVLSFISAPAPFPSLFEDQKLQKYLQWNAVVSAEADNFIAQSLKRPFIGIHLRNDVDWVSLADEKI